MYLTASSVQIGSHLQLYALPHSKVEDQITFVAKHSNAFYIEYEIDPKIFWDFKLIIDFLSRN